MFLDSAVQYIELSIGHRPYIQTRRSSTRRIDAEAGAASFENKVTNQTRDVLQQYGQV